jgi:hypothetical protein
MFAHVAFLADKGYGDDEIAFVVRRSAPLVTAYRRLLAEFQDKPAARRHLAEIRAGVEPKAPEEGGANHGPTITISSLENLRRKPSQVKHRVLVRAGRH